MKAALLALLLASASASAKTEGESYDLFCKRKPAVCESYDLREFFTLTDHYFELAGLDAKAGDFFASFEDADLSRFFKNLLLVTLNDPERIEQPITWMTNVWMHAYYLENQPSEMSYLPQDERGWRKIFIRNFFTFLSHLDSDQWKLLENFGSNHGAFLKISETLFDRTEALGEFLTWSVSKRHEGRLAYSEFLESLDERKIHSLVDAALEKQTTAHLEQLFKEPKTVQPHWKLRTLFDEGYWQVKADGFLGLYPDQHLDQTRYARVIFQPRLGPIIATEGWIVRMEFGSLWLKTKTGEVELSVGSGTFLGLFVRGSVRRPKDATFEQFRAATTAFYQSHNLSLKKCNWALVDALPLR